MKQKMYGVKISIDTHDGEGNQLNDSPVMDMKAISGDNLRSTLNADDEDSQDFLCNDQRTHEVTLEYLEARDRLDRMMYSV